MNAKNVFQKQLLQCFAAMCIATGLTVLIAHSQQAQAQAQTQANIPPHRALTPTPKLMQDSETNMLFNMRKTYTGDELHAFLRTHPDSEHVPTVLMRQGRSAQFEINALNHALKLLATAPPSAELSRRMGINDAAQLKAELQSYVDTLTVKLTNAQTQHRAATGKELDLGTAATGTLGAKFEGDVPSPMFTAPVSPLPYKLGYTWVVRMEDVLAQKTTDFTRTVTALLPFGYIEFNNGNLLMDLDGNIRMMFTPASLDGKTLSRKRRFDGNYRQYPQSLLRGREHTFGYVITDTMGDGKIYAQPGTNASMTTVAPETIDVPAGRFDTWRVVRRSDWKVFESGTEIRKGTFALTGWYSPVLRRHVKWEEISRNAAGVVVRHERHTLLKTD